MPLTTRKVTVEVVASVARVVLNNPPLNVIDLEMMDELREQLAALELRPGLTSIVFAGTERIFSSGVDFAADMNAMLAKFYALLRAVVASRKLTIASVRRHCLGGGAELALLCDMVYAANDAVFGFPEIKLGLFPPVAMVALSAVIGQKRAAELVLTARSITAKEAQEMGLVNAIADDPETLVAECLQRVAQLSPAALAVAKKAFYAWDAIHFDKGLARAEQIYREELMKTVDAKEGVQAFIEKRRPRWTGK